MGRYGGKVLALIYLKFTNSDNVTAPELIDFEDEDPQRNTQASDVFSLGCVYYEVGLMFSNYYWLY